MDDEEPPPSGSRLTPLIADHLALSSPPRRQTATQSSCKRSKRTRPRRSLERSVPSAKRRLRAIFNIENDEKVEISSFFPQKSTLEDPDKDISTEMTMQKVKSEIFSSQESCKVSLNCEVEGDDHRAVLKRAASSQTVLPSTAPTLKRCNLSEVTVGSVDTVHQPILPTVYSSRHPDLNVITPETVVQVLRGEFKDQLTGFELLDCRFPFEFQGGSLRGASSLCDPETMEMQFFKSTILGDCTRTALIFFCEFSANRAPKMLRHLRNVDRSLHADRYPELFYPELYLIDGGYKNCFEAFQREICAPPVAYVAMDDKQFAESCRREFAAWRRKWKPHKVVANCAAKFQHSSRPQLQGELVRPHVQDRSTVSHGVRSLFDKL